MVQIDHDPCLDDVADAQNPGQHPHSRILCSFPDGYQQFVMRTGFQAKGNFPNDKIGVSTPGSHPPWLWTQALALGCLPVLGGTPRSRRAQGGSLAFVSLSATIMRPQAANCQAPVGGLKLLIAS